MSYGISCGILEYSRSPKLVKEASPKGGVNNLDYKGEKRAKKRKKEKDTYKEEMFGEGSVRFSVFSKEDGFILVF